MNPIRQIPLGSGCAIIPDSTQQPVVVTLEDYLYGCVNIDVPREAIVRICLDRDVDMHEEAVNVEKFQRDLCKADLLVWMALGVTRRGTVSDADNGWTHSDGGFTISEADKNLFINIANRIYEANGEKAVGKISVSITSSGIRRADTTTDGIPMPHILQ